MSNSELSKEDTELSNAYRLLAKNSFEKNIELTKKAIRNRLLKVPRSWRSENF